MAGAAAAPHPSGVGILQSVTSGLIQPKTSGDEHVEGSDEACR